MKNPKTIIIKVTNSGIYLNPELCISWAQTNFPDKLFFSINNSREIYWEVEQSSYDESNCQLKLKPKNYQSSELSNHKEQSPKKTIKSLQFSGIDWETLSGFLNYYIRDKFFLEHNLISSNPRHDEDRNFDFKIDQNISKLEFKMGLVQTHKAVQGLSNKLLIQIPNTFIIPEFEHIKPYFKKLFGKSKISIYITVGNKNLRSSYAFYSPEIASIDENFLEAIKIIDIQRRLKKPQLIDIDKEIFSADDFFDSEEPVLGNDYSMSDIELINQILESKYVRNRKQLEYLSGRLQSTHHKILFTRTPDFGFIFSIEGEQMQHFIWEMINSNATYVWSYDKSLNYKTARQLIEHKIAYIKQQGRSKYILDESKDECIFNRIIHESANSNLIDAFPKWRHRLNEKLV